MTEIAVRADQHLEVPTGRDHNTAQLAQWAEAATAAHTLASGICSTQFVPAAYRGKVAEATAAILAGAEVGLSPMASLKAFHNIQGTPTLSAQALRGIVQGLGHEVTVVESDDKHAVVTGRRKGKEEWQTSTWTIERAEQAGYPAKNANWRTNPAAMLVARASTEVCRWIASDAIMGMPYTAEEVRDGGGHFGADRPRPMRVTAAEILGTVDHPATDPTGAFAAVDHDHDNADSPVEQAQLNRMGGLFRAKGVTDPDDGLALLSEVTGRTIAATRELTYGEARRVIDHLQQLPDEEPVDAAHLAGQG